MKLDMYCELNIGLIQKCKPLYLHVLKQVNLQSKTFNNYQRMNIVFTVRITMVK